MSPEQQERAEQWQAMLAYARTLPDVLGSYQNRAKVMHKMGLRERSHELVL